MPMSNQPRRTLLLTGASRGIGHATVKRFSAAGWRVITCSRHPFPENCPWEAGPEDHIQVDLADADNTDAAIAEIKRRLNGELHALVNNAAISPKADGGKRLGSIDTSRDDWHHVFQVNFFAPIMLARGLLDELKAAKGSVVNVTSIAGSRVHPFAGAAYATSKAALAALTREMAADFGARRRPRQRHRARRDRHRDAVARHGKDRRDDPDAPARHARRGGEDHLRAVHGDVVLRQRRRDPHQRRPARVMGARMIRRTDTPTICRPPLFIDSGDTAIQAFARKAIGKAQTTKDKAIALYRAVRDSIQYDPYLDFLDPGVFRASAVLDAGKGFCVGKSAVLAAAARATGIPARPGYADVRNHLTSQRLKASSWRHVLLALVHRAQNRRQMGEVYAGL